MANPSVTYTFANGNTTDATQVNTNFTDLINSLTDGTKSLSVDQITAAGAVAFNGNVTLGNGTPDDITISGSLASTIAIKTTNSYNIGSSTLGLAAIYFGSSSGSNTTKLQGAAVTGDIVFTLPITDGVSDGDVMATDGNGVLSFRALGKQASFSENVGLAAGTTSVSGDSITITGANGSSLSSSNPAYITIPSTTAGQFTTFKITADVTINLTGCHWGLGTFGDQSNYPLVIYAINNAGSIKYGVSTVEGLNAILDTDDDTTATNITTTKKVLVNSALSADSPCLELGWFKANFDDTGGSSEDLWTVQTGLKAINIGKCPPMSRKYYPTITGFGTIASQSFFWKKVGSDCFVVGSFKAGTVSATPGLVAGISGHSIDTTQINTTARVHQFGNFAVLDTTATSVATDFGMLTYDGSSATTFLIAKAVAGTANYTFNNSNANGIFNSNTVLTMKFDYPVATWT